MYTLHLSPCLTTFQGRFLFVPTSADASRSIGRTREKERESSFQPKNYLFVHALVYKEKREREQVKKKE